MKLVIVAAAFLGAAGWVLPDICVKFDVRNQELSRMQETYYTIQERLKRKSDALELLELRKTALTDSIAGRTLVPVSHNPHSEEILEWFEVALDRTMELAAARDLNEIHSVVSAFVNDQADEFADLFTDLVSRKIVVEEMRIAATAAALALETKEAGHMKLVIEARIHIRATLLSHCLRDLESLIGRLQRTNHPQSDVIRNLSDQRNRYLQLSISLP